MSKQNKIKILAICHSKKHTYDKIKDLKIYNENSDNCSIDTNDIFGDDGGGILK